MLRQPIPPPLRGRRGSVQDWTRFAGRNQLRAELRRQRRSQLAVSLSVADDSSDHEDDTMARSSPVPVHAPYKLEHSETRPDGSLSDLYATEFAELAHDVRNHSVPVALPGTIGSSLAATLESTVAHSLLVQDALEHGTRGQQSLSLPTLPETRASTSRSDLVHQILKALQPMVYVSDARHGEVLQMPQVDLQDRKTSKLNGLSYRKLAAHLEWESKRWQIQWQEEKRQRERSAVSLSSIRRRLQLKRLQLVFLAWRSECRSLKAEHRLLDQLMEQQAESAGLQAKMDSLEKLRSSFLLWRVWTACAVRGKAVMSDIQNRRDELLLLRKRLDERNSQDLAAADHLAALQEVLKELQSNSISEFVRLRTGSAGTSIPRLVYVLEQQLQDQLELAGRVQRSAPALHLLSPSFGSRCTAATAVDRELAEREQSNWTVDHRREHWIELSRLAEIEAEQERLAFADLLGVPVDSLSDASTTHSGFEKQRTGLSASERVLSAHQSAERLVVAWMNYHVKVVDAEKSQASPQTNHADHASKGDKKRAHHGAGRRKKKKKSIVTGSGGYRQGDATSHTDDGMPTPFHLRRMSLSVAEAMIGGLATRDILQRRRSCVDQASEPLRPVEEKAAVPDSGLSHTKTIVEAPDGEHRDGTQSRRQQARGTLMPAQLFPLSLAAQSSGRSSVELKGAAPREQTAEAAVESPAEPPHATAQPVNEASKGVVLVNLSKDLVDSRLYIRLLQALLPSLHHHRQFVDAVTQFNWRTRAEAVLGIVQELLEPYRLPITVDEYVDGHPQKHLFMLCRLFLLCHEVGLAGAPSTHIARSSKSLGAWDSWIEAQRERLQQMRQEWRRLIQQDRVKRLEVMQCLYRFEDMLITVSLMEHRLARRSALSAQLINSAQQLSYTLERSVHRHSAATYTMESPHLPHQLRQLRVDLSATSRIRRLFEESCDVETAAGELVKAQKLVDSLIGHIWQVFEHSVSESRDARQYKDAIVAKHQLIEEHKAAAAAKLQTKSSHGHGAPQRTRAKRGKKFQTSRNVSGAARTAAAAASALHIVLPTFKPEETKRSERAVAQLNDDTADAFLAEHLSPEESFAEQKWFAEVDSPMAADRVDFPQFCACLSRILGVSISVLPTRARGQQQKKCYPILLSLRYAFVLSVLDSSRIGALPFPNADDVARGIGYSLRSVEDSGVLEDRLRRLRISARDASMSAAEALIHRRLRLGLTWPQFVEALIRCALIIYSSASPRFSALQSESHLGTGAGKWFPFSLTERCRLFLESDLVPKGARLGAHAYQQSVQSVDVQRVIDSYRSVLEDIFHFYTFSSPRTAEPFSLSSSSTLQQTAPDVVADDGDQTSNLLRLTAGAPLVRVPTRIYQGAKSRLQRGLFGSEKVTEAGFISLIKDSQLLSPSFASKQVSEIVAMVAKHKYALGSTSPSVAAAQGEGNEPDTEQTQHALTFPEFIDALGVVAHYKNPNPFLQLDTKLDVLIRGVADRMREKGVLRQSVE